MQRLVWKFPILKIYLKVMMALSDKTRCNIITMLQRRAICVCEMQAVVHALLKKGQGFMMRHPLALPKMVIQRQVLMPRLLGVFIALVAAGIMLVGYLYNTIM